MPALEGGWQGWQSCRQRGLQQRDRCAVSDLGLGVGQGGVSGWSEVMLKPEVEGHHRYKPNNWALGGWCLGLSGFGVFFSRLAFL